jgi:hypothetical protein
VSVLLGDGRGRFGPATAFPAGEGPHWVAVGDFDGDAKPDLAVPNSLSDDLSVLLGSGSFPPVASDDSYRTSMVSRPGEGLHVPAPGLLRNDHDPQGDVLRATPVVGPGHGSSLTVNPDGSFTYQPEPRFVGTDGFVYQVRDGTNASNFATVTIRVEPPG